MKITVTFEQSQLKNKAMVQAGICPRSMALKPGNRVHVDRKRASVLGRVKHKGRLDY